MRTVAQLLAGIAVALAGAIGAGPDMTRRGHTPAARDM